MLIVGAINFSNQTDSSKITEKMCATSLKYSHLTAIELFSTTQICIRTIQRGQHSPHIDRLATSSGEVFLLGDISYFKRTEPDSGLAENNHSTPGRWIRIEAMAEPAKVTLTTDILGSAWVYYAKIPGGYAFANDFSALVKSLPYTPSIDADGVGSELALSYATDDTTIFKEIKVLPAASAISFDSAGVKISSHEPITFNDNAARLSEQEKFEKLDAIYSSIVSNYISHFEENLVLSLSAGYDSRYALATLHHHGVNPSYCTFGNPGSSEVINAQIVANYMGASTNIFDYKAGRWNEWVSAIEYLGTTGMIQWNGWAERWLRFESQFGSASVSGYLGDALTGKHLGDNPNQNQDWVATWLEWSTGGCRLNSPLISHRLRTDLSESVSDNLLRTLKDHDFAFPHQAAMYLDLFGRQRRRVANQANLTSRFLTPILFFYDRQLIEFWCSLGFEDLHKQKMYIKYATSRFNELFSIFDQGKKRNLFARLGNKYDNLVRLAVSRKTSPPRPKVIDHDNLITPNILDILSLIERVEPVLTDVIDLNILREYLAKPSASTISSAQAIQAVNCCILANLIVN